MKLDKVFKRIIYEVKEPRKQRYLWFAFCSMYFDRNKRLDGFLPIKLNNIATTLHIDRRKTKNILVFFKKVGILRTFAYQKRLNRFKKNDLHGVYFNEYFGELRVKPDV